MTLIEWRIYRQVLKNSEWKININLKTAVGRRRTQMSADKTKHPGGKRLRHNGESVFSPKYFFIFLYPRLSDLIVRQAQGEGREH